MGFGRTKVLNCSVKKMGFRLTKDLQNKKKKKKKQLSAPLVNRFTKTLIYFLLVRSSGEMCMQITSQGRYNVVRKYSCFSASVSAIP